MTGEPNKEGTESINNNTKLAPLLPGGVRGGSMRCRQVLFDGMACATYVKISLSDYRRIGMTKGRGRDDKEGLERNPLLCIINCCLMGS